MPKKPKLAFGALPLLAVALLTLWYFHHHSIAVLNPQGQVGNSEYHLIIITLLLSLIVVVPVFSLLVGIVWRYREGRPHASYSPDLDHSRAAETIWWLVPSILILILGFIIWNSSHQLDPYRPLSSSSPPLTIQVIALNWKWLFIYPQQNLATVNFVQFPEHTSVAFEITADAPMNSFWIPQLGGQMYAMPGMSTQLHLSADRTGSFYGSSANISGRGFAGMHFIAKASTPAEFNSWVRQVKQAPNHLTPSAYNQLAAASTNNPVAYYSSGPSGLYDRVITKYMGPMSTMQNMEMP